MKFTRERERERERATEEYGQQVREGRRTRAHIERVLCCECRKKEYSRRLRCMLVSLSRVCGREMARAYRREKELKERGEGEGMALRDTIAQEAFSPTSMGSMMMGGVSHDVGGSVERDTLAAALAQQAADGEPSATMAAMAMLMVVGDDGDGDADDGRRRWRRWRC